MSGGNLFFCPDIYFVGAAEAGFFDGFAGALVAAVAAEAEGFFAGAWNDLGPVDRNRAECALACLWYRFEVYPDFWDCVLYAA